ncbi:hypothetical protein [Roseovarius dicentrarchi]|uniref:hypothetical protein n=1 Tax=Roseovarius dicentrarchi TaxID=2250573 RepID=UPI000DEBA4F0|nr:hypothetical protein [Roseovarius dicentrarchi]
MESAFPNKIMDALIALAFDIPPIAHPPVDPITEDAIRMGHKMWPVVDINTTPHRVIGVTTSGWTMIDGIGWRRLHGDVVQIAEACNVMQSRLIADRAAYMASLELYLKRSDKGIVGGLTKIDVGDGRCAIRKDDITAPAVKEAFLDAVRCQDISVAVDPVRPSTFAAVGSDHIDANVWWQFAWEWKTSIQT